MTMALLDSGADTCLAGAEFYVEEETDEVVHVIGFQDHMNSKDMKIGTAIQRLPQQRVRLSYYGRATSSLALREVH
ncbi:MAG: hypothetical protein ACREOZ_03940 [Gloeomargaritales cyanobacterium]